MGGRPWEFIGSRENQIKQKTGTKHNRGPTMRLHGASNWELVITDTTGRQLPIGLHHRMVKILCLVAPCRHHWRTEEVGKGRHGSSDQQLGNDGRSLNLGDGRSLGHRQSTDGCWHSTNGTFPPVVFLSTFRYATTR